MNAGSIAKTSAKQLESTGRGFKGKNLRCIEGSLEIFDRLSDVSSDIKQNWPGFLAYQDSYIVKQIDTRNLTLMADATDDISETPETIAN